MKISFLSAADRTPLTKHFSLENGQLKKDSYPHVLNFSSTTYDVESMQQFYDLTKEHGSRGHCLLKGELNKPLDNESRAGTTNSHDQTQWLLFDLDGITGYDTVEEFISEALPEPFHNATYILHQSSSAGLVEQSGLNCHMAFFMTQPYSAPSLKTWLESINYSSDVIRNQLKLTASGTSLRYPLDVTTCQNDKLIFMATPVFADNLEDPLGEDRVQLIQKQDEYVQFLLPQISPEKVRGTKDDVIAKLRADAGLKKKKFTYKTDNNVTYIANPDEVSITGVRHARGFVYLNLNGGDSWAYYFFADSPTYVYNFKEPDIAFKLEDLNNEFANAYAKELESKPIEIRDRHPIIFRDIATAHYYNGFFIKETHELELYKAKSRDQLKDFCINNDVSPPKVIPDRKLMFDPTKIEFPTAEAATLNTFQPTKYMMLDTENPGSLGPITDRIINHVMNYDDDCYNWFMNWLACVFQSRTKVGTAWIMTGTEGTGKGLLFDMILAPILGKYAIQRGLVNIEDNFNGWEQETILLNFNEARLTESAAVSKVLNKLKQMITDPTATIRNMYSDQVKTTSHINLLITSNYNDAIVLTISDRRFWVAPRQEEKIEITTAEVEAIPGELEEFATYLLNYDADFDLARTPVLNDAKLAMVSATLSAHEQLFTAVREGDLEYFAQHLTTRQDPTIINEYTEFSRILMRWLNLANKEEPARIRKQELHSVYNFLQAKRPVQPNVFGRMLKHNDIETSRMRIDGELTYGLWVDWKCDEDIVNAWIRPPQADDQAET